MPEVEYMSGTPLCLIEDPLRLCSKRILFCKQHDRIEISHYGHIMTHASPAFIESDTPVEPEHIAARFAHQLEQRSCSSSKVNYRNTRHNVSNHVLRMRQYEFPIVVGTQTTHP